LTARSAREIGSPASRMARTTSERREVGNGKREASSPFRRARRSSAYAPVCESHLRTAGRCRGSGYLSLQSRRARARSMSLFEPFSRVRSEGGSDANRLETITGSRASLSTLPSSLGADLRQPDPRGADGAPEREELGDPFRGRDALPPLVAHPLRRQLRESLRVGLGGLERPGVNPELEPGAEAQGPQDAEIVLLEAPVGIAHGANHMGVEVCAAIEGVFPLVL